MDELTAAVTPRAHLLLGLLALPYAGHPDYRQEWAPVHSDG